MNNELQRIWKESVVACFKVLFWYLLPEESHERPESE
jgi:hypothetical protein